MFHMEQRSKDCAVSISAVRFGAGRGGDMLFRMMTLGLTTLSLMLYVLGAGAETKGGRVMKIKVESTAFNEGGMIPKKYACDGQDLSPPISWSGIPDAAKSIALIADDPDAPMGTWVHWVVYNLPANITGLPEGVPPQKTITNNGRQGTNDFRRIGYGGPCPPGGTHRYFFKVYALDIEVNLDAGATKAQLLKAMEGHLLAEGELMGRYQRR